MIFELLNEKKCISNISYMLFPLLRLPSNASCLRGSTTHSLWPSGMSNFCKVSLDSHLLLSRVLPWLFALWFLIYKSIFMWGGNKSLAASCIFHFSFVVGLVLREEPFLKKKKIIEFEVPGESEIIHGSISWRIPRCEVCTYNPNWERIKTKNGSLIPLIVTLENKGVWWTTFA